ncbi:MAG: CHAT domain-containing protein [Rubrivivax sp.]
MAGDLPGLDQPALALAATGEEATDPLAPLLRLDDVLQLRLNADWVVLSACNTAAADGRAEALSRPGARLLLRRRPQPARHPLGGRDRARGGHPPARSPTAAHPEAGKAESLPRDALS